jgi:hypothetical protein
MNFKEFVVIQEISKDYLDKMSLDAVNLPWNNIFGDKLRIKVDYVPDYSFLDSNEIIYIKDKRAFFKRKDDRQKNRLKLSKAVSNREDEDTKSIKSRRKEQAFKFKKLLEDHPEEAKALVFYMHVPIPILLDEIQDEGFNRTFLSMYNSSKTEVKELLDYLLKGDREYWWVPDQEYADKMKDYSLIKNSSEKYSLVISRAPIDVLRASDFENIISCFSPKGRGKDQEGIHFNDLCETALAGSGIVYILPELVATEAELQMPEILKDIERGVKGHSPIARLIVRQFVNNDGQQLMIPEVRIFGSLANNMKRVVYKEVAQILKDLQHIDRPLDYKEWYMRGSKYIDTEINEEELLTRFNGV